MSSSLAILKLIFCTALFLLESCLPSSNTYCMLDPLLYDYRQFLVMELSKRNRRNSAYSLRSFARDLGLSPSSLSEIVNRRAGLSPEKASLLAERLKLDPFQQQIFSLSAGMLHSRSEEKRRVFWRKLRSLNLQNLVEAGKNTQAQVQDWNGVWKVTARLASGGGNPKSWEPLHETQHFVFRGDQFEFHQDRIGVGRTVLAGSFSVDGFSLSSPSRLQSFSGTSPIVSKPWLAESHSITVLSPHQFHLSTAPEFFTRPICPVGESLETIWTRVSI